MMASFQDAMLVELEGTARELMSVEQPDNEGEQRGVPDAATPVAASTP